MAEILYTLVEGAEGMNLNPSTGLLTWNPVRGQNYSDFRVKISAKDKTDKEAFQCFIVKIQDQKEDTSETDCK
jgi:hypothetical protein